MGKEDTNRWKYLKEGMMIIATTIPFVFWLYRYINMDFWYDELWSLINYTFVPFKKTITDYTVPNNHIFFNLINNFYLKFIGIKDVYYLMDHPYKIRLLTLFYTPITLLYVYLISNKFFNSFVAHLSLMVLVTTIPYYNFSVQIRGYSLSMMLLCITLYYVWSFEENYKWKYGLLFVFSASLSIYTITSNLYFIFSIGIFYFSKGVYELIKRRRDEGNILFPQKIKVEIPVKFNIWQYLKNGYFNIFFLICVSIIIAILLYIPIIRDVIYNPFMKSHGAFYMPTLYKTMPTVFYYFLSARYFFIPAVILGLFIMFFQSENPQLVQKTILCVSLLFIPFIFSFVRGDLPYDRVFLNLTPIFALVVSVSIYFLQSTISVLRSKMLLIICGMMLYCNVIFSFCIGNISEHLRSDIELGQKSQDIYYNYYQAYYHPLKLLSSFIQSHPIDSIPIIVYDVDRIAIPNYLNKLKTRWYLPNILEEMLRTQKKIYVITTFSDNFKMLLQMHPQFQCKRINEHLDFHSIFLLTKMAD